MEIKGSIASDVYAFSIILWEILNASKYFPYGGAVGFEIAYPIVKFGKRPSLDVLDEVNWDREGDDNEGMGSERKRRIIGLLNSSWCSDRNERLSTKELTDILNNILNLK